MNTLRFNVVLLLLRGSLFFTHMRRLIESPAITSCITSSSIPNRYIQRFVNSMKVQRRLPVSCKYWIHSLSACSHNTSAPPPPGANKYPFLNRFALAEAHTTPWCRKTQRILCQMGDGLRKKRI